MIYIKLSFNVDQPEITVSSRFKVTVENVKTFKCDFAKKIGQFIYLLLQCMAAWNLGTSLQFQAPNSSRIGPAICQILIR